MSKDEEQFQEYQRQKQDVTKNLPKDWEKQLHEDELKADLEKKRREQLEDIERQHKIREKMDAAKKASVDHIKEQGKVAAEKQKDLEARAQKQKDIAEKAERIKRNQEDAEKTKEFKEIKQKNEARIKATADEQSALLNAKTNTERIRVRQRIEARQRAENERIRMVNSGKQPQTGHRLITPGTIKDSIRSSVSRAPANFDKLVTGAMGGITEKMISPVPRAKQNVAYRGEMKMMSKVVNRRQISPTPVKQILVLHKGDLMANPDFTQSLIGQAPLQTQTAKNIKASKKTGKSTGLLSKLDNFAKGLL